LADRRTTLLIRMLSGGFNYCLQKREWPVVQFAVGCFRMEREKLGGLVAE